MIGRAGRVALGAWVALALLMGCGATPPELVERGEEVRMPAPAAEPAGAQTPDGAQTLDGARTPKTAAQGSPGAGGPTEAPVESPPGSGAPVAGPAAVEVAEPDPERVTACACPVVAVTTCPSGWCSRKAKVRSMVRFEGRPVYFCCSTCVVMFKKDPARYAEHVRAQQKALGLR